MIKSWDWQDLIDRAKKNGIVLVEKEAKDLTSCVLDWTADSLVLEGGTVAALAAPAIAFVKPYVLQLEDKIDGVDGN